MDSEPISIRTLVHHIEHLVLYSLVWWQIVLGVKFLLNWINKNWKTKSNTSPTSVGQPVINIDGSSIGEGMVKGKKDMGPVEVDLNRNISVGKADKSKLKMDETIKGKVKTQKDKLKKLRG